MPRELVERLKRNGKESGKRPMQCQGKTEPPYLQALEDFGPC